MKGNFDESHQIHNFDEINFDKLLSLFFHFGYIVWLKFGEFIKLVGALYVNRIISS